jgi:hypothetical protein
MKRDAVADKVADLPSGKFVVLYADRLCLTINVISELGPY